MSDASALLLIHSVTTARDEAELLSRVSTAARGMGFEHFMLGIEIQRPLVPTMQHVSSGYPEAWQRLYLEREYIGIDPTVGYCQTETTPVVWSESLYPQASLELMEESRHHGLGYGMSIPVHESARVKSMVSLARDQPLANAELAIMKAGGEVLAHCAHVATQRLIVPALLEERRPSLSPRELECLRWAAQGKGSGVIGDILSVSEATVNFHMTNAMKKLGVASRLQAVAIGVALGLIT